MRTDLAKESRLLTETICGISEQVEYDEQTEILRIDVLTEDAAVPEPPSSAGLAVSSAVFAVDAVVRVVVTVVRKVRTVGSVKGSSSS